MNLKTADRFYLIAVVVIIAAMPLGISAFDTSVRNKKIPDHAKVFHLTGNTVQGWVNGDIQAADVLFNSIKPVKPSHPVLHAKKGDTVVIRLSSSDVIHGFSLKDFGIFINDGIHPGRPVIVTFTADKAGTFSFACNAICGSLHENMTGTIIISA